MKTTLTSIADVIVLEPAIFADDRGFLLESYNQRDLEQSAGIAVRFVQDNHSQSRRGVLRGLHYQLPPVAQGKLMRVVAGEIFDVAVDIRKGSPTFGKWVGQILSAENKKQMWIPAGFAHGFVTLSEIADVLYKVTDYHAPETARSIAWNDPDIGIEWPLPGPPVLSEKDVNAPPFKSADIFS